MESTNVTQRNSLSCPPYEEQNAIFVENVHQDGTATASTSTHSDGPSSSSIPASHSLTTSTAPLTSPAGRIRLGWDPRAQQMGLDTLEDLLSNLSWTRAEERELTDFMNRRNKSIVWLWASSPLTFLGLTFFLVFGYGDDGPTGRCPYKDPRIGRILFWVDMAFLFCFFSGCFCCFAPYESCCIARPLLRRAWATFSVDGTRRSEELQTRTVEEETEGIQHL